MKRFLPFMIAALIPILAQAAASYTIYPIPHQQIVDESSSASGMAKLMEKVRATAIYTQEEAADWLTEHSGEGLTIKSPREDFLRILCDQKEKYEHRDRLNPKGDWITWHTSVYDIDQKKLTVWSQEDYTRPFIFIL